MIRNGSLQRAATIYQTHPAVQGPDVNYVFGVDLTNLITYIWTMQAVSNIAECFFSQGDDPAWRLKNHYLIYVAYR